MQLKKSQVQTNTIELLDDFEVYIEKYIYREDVIFTATPKASMLHLRYKYKKY